jgi:hypothetical protein
MRTLTSLFCLTLPLAGCVDEALSGDGEPASDTLPDGTRGVQRVERGGQLLDVTWVARDGLKWIDDDFSIGPALTVEPYAASSASVGKWANNHLPCCIHLLSEGFAMGLTNAQAQIVDDALEELHKITPVTFDKHTCGSSSCRRPSSTTGCGRPPRQA